MKSLRTLVNAIASCGSLCAPLLSLAEEERVDFQRQIRPLLSANCFYCHGPEDEHREAKLRLDDPVAATAEVIVPGKPEESEIMFRLRSADPDKIMPPPDSGKSLQREEIELIRQWIGEGAEYKEHWAFVPPVRGKVPLPTGAVWVRNPIDAFVLKRLEKEGLTPSPEADSMTLRRRLGFDLIGLPPSPEEMDENASHADAVGRLLNSPAYGEHWARMWLDAARYADSNGYEKDSPREAWFYRDWVIRSLNDDMPYDRFVIEQIAGDLLPDATQEQIVATGFLRNSMINEEGGADPEQFRVEAMFDRMDAIGKGVLGLTVRCAQCHSHKFDPIKHEDYYAMFAFLNNSAEGSITVYSDEQQRERDQVLEGVRMIESELRARHPDWETRMTRWEAEVKAAPLTEWKVLPLTPNDTAAGGQKFLPQEDGSYLAQGYSPSKSTPVFQARNPLAEVTAFRLEALRDANLPRQGPGRSMTGMFALTEFEVGTRPLDGKESGFEKRPLAEATADVSPPTRPIDPYFVDPKGKEKEKRVEGPIEYAIDGKADTAWSIDVGAGRRNVSRQAVFRLEKPLALAEAGELEIALSHQHGGYNNNDNYSRGVGRFRISVTDDPFAKADLVPPEVRAILAIPREQRTGEQAGSVFAYWRTTVPEFAEANAKIDALYADYPDGHAQFVLNELSPARKTHLLGRGDFLSPKEEVAPGVPSFLHPLPEGAPHDRLAFARWLVARDSPTAARSIVNRVWQGYFGIGLVSTSEDLGSQGEMPSHPELLDWLAVEFMENGWSLKHLHRLIVMSATYRQSSRVTRELQELDPENRLLARGARFRLGAEAVRDGALLASGLLKRKVGGPSVHPPAPRFLFEPPASYGYKTWDEDTGPDRYRRALYTFQFRSAQYPGQQVFDAPTGEVSCVRRPISNTPLQALTTLNEPLFFECARALASRTLREGGADDAARLDYAFRRCLTRPPEPEESATLLGLLQKQRERLAAGALDAAKLAGKTDGAVAETAAWVAVARVLLNLDETLTKQ